MKLLLRLVISTLAVLVAAHLVPGVVVASTGTAIIVAIVLGLLNTF
jgi:putative membrane protein